MRVRDNSFPIYCATYGFLLALAAMLPVHAQDSVEAEVESERGVIQRQLEVEILQKQLDQALGQAFASGEEEAKNRVEELKQALIQTRRELAERRRALYRELSNNRTEQAKPPRRQATPLRADDQLRMYQVKVQQLEQLLADAHRTIKDNRETDNPSLNNVETRVYHLKYVDARFVERTLREILGEDLLRMAIGENPQVLLLSGQKPVMTKATELIQNLDNPEAANRPSNDLPVSLMARIFWLSDGQTHPETQQPAGLFLPDSVMKALAQLGVEDPFVVLQSNTSVALQGTSAVGLDVSDIPAIVFGERLHFTAQGQLEPLDGNRVRFLLDARIRSKRGPRGEQGENNSFGGSMIAPLEHYMVLGTSNYTAAAAATATGRGRGGFDGGFGESGDLAEAESAPDFRNTRFAFVVQLVEAKSFAPTEPTDDRPAGRR